MRGDDLDDFRIETTNKLIETTNKLIAANKRLNDQLARLQGKINVAYSRTEDLLAILDGKAEAEIGSQPLNVLTGLQGEMLDAERKRYVERLGYVDSDSIAKAVNETLELCALVADEYSAWPAREIAATIRAKKVGNKK